MRKKGNQHSKCEKALCSYAEDLENKISLLWKEIRKMKRDIVESLEESRSFHLKVFYFYFLLLFFIFIFYYYFLFMYLISFLGDCFCLYLFYFIFIYFSLFL